MNNIFLTLNSFSHKIILVQRYLTQKLRVVAESIKIVASNRNESCSIEIDDFIRDSD